VIVRLEVQAGGAAPPTSTSPSPSHDGAMGPGAALQPVDVPELWSSESLPAPTGSRAEAATPADHSALFATSAPLPPPTTGHGHPHPHH